MRVNRSLVVFAGATALAAGAAFGLHRPDDGMVRLPAGTFMMGAAPVRPDEGPPHTVNVGAFAIDRTDVTNAQFAKFIAATGYVTEAERPLSGPQYAGLTDAQRAPASLVFVGANPGVNMADPGQWWRVIPGADWRHPRGPGSSITGHDNDPVVQIAYADALAYAAWRGHDLPTEAEWEYAARGGLPAARYPWGEDERPAGRVMANTWQGEFPVEDRAEDGYHIAPSPVGSFPANGYGLFDMAGNVWQWTKDVMQPAGDPPRRVIKGGSFLCAHNYCFRYRPAAREQGPPDGGASHIGFRTVLRQE